MKNKIVNILIDSDESIIKPTNNIEINDKAQICFNFGLVKAVFNILLKENKISKKEYDNLVLGAKRTFNFS